VAAEERRETRAHFGTAQAARITGLSPARLRRCAQAHLVSPHRDARGRLQFGFLDLVLLRTTRGLLDQRVPAREINRVLRSLRRQIGDRPLTRLSVYADGDRVVAWDGHSRWQPNSGQFLFNFDAGKVLQQARKIAHLREPVEPQTVVNLPLTPEQWIDLAMELERTSPLEARAAYHHALDLEPTNLTARINLGCLLHAEKQLLGAEAHYREVVRLDPTCGLAWYNLGVVIEDAGRATDALACYEAAVRAAPDIADAHFNLALLYERGGRRPDALKHFAIYKRLSPKRR
jgi:tetratricopeptide (TPR) repeat protein